MKGRRESDLQSKRVLYNEEKIKHKEDIGMGNEMKKIYITIAGMNFRYGTDILERGDIVTLVKEPDNEYDNEAIKVMVGGLGHIGYVANSVRTVLGDCYSAGRLYDLIGKKATAKVKYITDRGVVCVVNIK